MVTQDNRRLSLSTLRSGQDCICDHCDEDSESCGATAASCEEQAREYYGELEFESRRDDQ